MKEPVIKVLDPAMCTKHVPDVRKLYLETGWIQPDTDTAFLEPMLRNSFRVMGAFDGDRLIGMMRALSDGVSDAYLLDMVVAPAYRRRGIASGIVRELTAELRKCGIDWIVCISVPEAEKLYLKQGYIMQKHVPIRFGTPDTALPESKE